LRCTEGCGDEQGRYQLLNLNVGRYEIEVSLSGFQTAVRSGIVLAVGDQTVVNFTLQVGQVAEKVEVTAQAPLVDTTTSSVGGIIETSQIVNLPLNGRSFDELAQLQPGVTVAKFAGVGTMQSGYTTKITGVRLNLEENQLVWIAHRVRFFVGCLDHLQNGLFLKQCQAKNL